MKLDRTVKKNIGSISWWCPAFCTSHLLKSSVC